MYGVYYKQISNNFLLYIYKQKICTLMKLHLEKNPLIFKIQTQIIKMIIRVKRVSFGFDSPKLAQSFKRHVCLEGVVAKMKMLNL